MLTLLGRGGFARPVNALSAYKIPRRWKKKKAKGKASPDVNLGSQDENIDLSMYRTNMEKAVDVFRRDLGSIRTSGANPSILDSAFARTISSSQYVCYFENDPFRNAVCEFQCEVKTKGS